MSPFSNRWYRRGRFTNAGSLTWRAILSPALCPSGELCPCVGRRDMPVWLLLPFNQQPSKNPWLALHVSGSKTCFLRPNRSVWPLHCGRVPGREARSMVSGEPRGDGVSGAQRTPHGRHPTWSCHNQSRHAKMEAGGVWRAADLFKDDGIWQPCNVLSCNLYSSIHTHTSVCLLFAASFLSIASVLKSLYISLNSSWRGCFFLFFFFQLPKHTCSSNINMNTNPW